MASWRAKHGMKPVRVHREDYDYANWRSVWEPNYISMMSGWPAWWDRVFHTRRKRAEIRRLEGKVMRGEVDPDNLSWPLGSRKPHQYFW